MNKHSNPFNITFGEEPNSIIFRKEEFDDIVELFQDEQPESKIKIITGPRGCGKTVLLSQIKKYFDEKDGWLTADLTQYSNMLEQLAGKLYESGKIKHLFLKGEFSFSFKGLGFSIHGEQPISNIESLLDKIFDYLNKKGKRVLVTIDDVSNNEYVKQFIQTYQSLIRSKFQIYLLMTGLYENVSSLQNINNLTFLLRAPKIQLSKLSIRSIALSYKALLGISSEESIEMAKLTNGYAYAYQLIGNALYKNSEQKLNQSEIDKIDLELENNVYGKIWEGLSLMDKQMLFAMLKFQQANDIIKYLNINNAKFQVYRKRLMDIGVVDGSERGSLSFALPRFYEYVEFQKELMED